MERIDGQRLSLRLVTPNDAAYIQELRLDPRYNTHLSEVTGTVNDQRAWIENYKLREALGQEYYYIIEKIADGVPCGVVRLYDILENQCTWGSWILDENKPPKAALESAFLSFGAAFDRIGIVVANLDVRKKNIRALSFYRRFGMIQTGEDDLNNFFEYTSERFEADRARHVATILDSE